MFFPGVLFEPERAGISAMIGFMGSRDSTAASFSMNFDGPRWTEIRD